VAIKPEPTADRIESQDTFIENRDPTEITLCLILAAAYLGLAKYCWIPLWSAKNLKLFLNVEGFFITIAIVSILVGLRPYLNPASMQISHRGIKYRGPYWPQRRSVTWDQVVRVYLSSDLIFVLFKPNPNKKGMWAMIIASIYLASRENIAHSFETYCARPLEIVSNPTLYSRILLGFIFFITVIWILEMLMD
jgi:hypothetical protein